MTDGIEDLSDVIAFAESKLLMDDSTSEISVVQEWSVALGLCR